MNLTLNSAADLSSTIKPKVKLNLQKNEKKTIELNHYIELKGPVFDLYSSKMKNGKNERLIG